MEKYIVTLVTEEIELLRPFVAKGKHAAQKVIKHTASGDAGYQGVEKRPENPGKAVEWLVAMKRSVRKALPADELGRLQDRFEKLKASIRAKVEHPFHVLKNLFRHRKVRYL